MLLTRRVVIPLLGLLAVVLSQAACPLLPEQDNFRCGIRANGTITRCDGPGELCLCGGQSRQDKNRCATPEDPSLCPSGFRYTFPDESNDDLEDDGYECVPQESLERYVTADSNALCDSQGEAECGLPAADGTTLRCGFNQFCFCPKNRCAEPWPACAANDGGLPARFVSSDECIGSHDGDLQSVRERPNGICPGLLVDDLFPDAGPPGGGSGTPDAGGGGGDSGTPDAGGGGGADSGTPDAGVGDAG